MFYIKSITSLKVLAQCSDIDNIFKLYDEFIKNGYSDIFVCSD